MSIPQGDSGLAPPDNITDTISQSSASTLKEEDEDAPPMRRDPKLCGICEKEVGKYKCPQCFMPYCSIACNRTHKESHPPPAETSQKPSQQSVPPAQKKEDPYAILLDNEFEFKRLFKKYPFLPDELSKILQNTLPPDSSTDGATNRSGFPTSFKQPYGKKQHAWSRMDGLLQGVAALRQARTDPTEIGDGIRECCDLILYLLSSQKSQTHGGPRAVIKDLTEVVREEVVAEETEIIARLNQEEAGEDRDK
ncbi:hypothetical protein B0T16DRAFT_454576 [Cercophora newfieldiana]|uniref:HIT-type domain-containing protein n=1 Tax=Cercophora newfieldiana TaxID=92897 RepID=A0AA39YJM9_9PEZI|nr:hypothetical protein B0T16DRAFT_454576 [Cercophora newfieldiana]